MAQVIITVEYDNGDYTTYRQNFNPLVDAKVYARVARMQRARQEAWDAKLPFNRAKKLYRDLLAAGVVHKGQIITNAEAKELAKKLEPQHLF
jgi:hypothetical protein